MKKRQIEKLGASVAAAILFASCAADPRFTTSSTSTSTGDTQTLLEESLTGVRVKFDSTSFYTLTSPNSLGCAGDVKTYYDPLTGLALQADENDSTTTIHPAFIKDVSVDVTDANSTAGTNMAFGCSYGSASGTPAATSCAEFDDGSYAAGYSTGFYSTFDAVCSGVGPISSTDPSISKLLAGGVYFDIDRTKLGSSENLLLDLTFIPLGQQNKDGTSTSLTSADTAVFKIHLIATGQTAAEIEKELQPRYLTYTGNGSYPEVVQSLSVISPPTGQPRTEQVLIPLASDSTIDRIRIERYSGNAILVDASLFRMGSS